MSNSGQYILAVQLSEPKRFRDIFGEIVTALARDDVARGVTRLSETLLQRYRCESEVISSEFGFWYVVFTPIVSVLNADMAEQGEAICAAGAAMVRELFCDCFGEATGSRLGFSVIIAKRRENVLRPAIGDILAQSLASVNSKDICNKGVIRADVVDIIDHGLHETYFQPIVSLADSGIVGYEALARGPQGSPLRDAEALFTAARNFGLTLELELACLQQALKWLPKIPKPLWVSVNLGPNLFTDAKFQSYIQEGDVQACLPRTVFELTEHLPVESAAQLHAAAAQSRKRRIRLSLDDTGCGFFDLTTVAELRPEIVKLCITVVSRIGRSSDVEREMRNAIAEISRLGACTLGEGVEQGYQAEILEQCGATLAQGNFFGVPRPASEVFPL